MSGSFYASITFTGSGARGKSVFFILQIECNRAGDHV